MSMNPAFFLTNLDRLITGHGFKKEVQIPLTALHNENDGTLLSNTTIATDDAGYDHISNTILFVWGTTGGNGNVDEVSFEFVVPQDYDETEDYLRIRLKAYMAGATDTPYLDANVYKNGVDADLDPTASADLSATAAWVEIVISNKTESLVAGDVLTISLLPEDAHDTDGIGVYGIAMEYKSDLVYYDPDDR